MCMKEAFSRCGPRVSFSPQLASVILKQYVETHWCAHSEKFRPPETTERVRTVADRGDWTEEADWCCWGHWCSSGSLTGSQVLSAILEKCFSSKFHFPTSPKLELKFQLPENCQRVE